MKNIISIILGILMFLKLMELLYGAIFLDKPLNPITKIIFILTLIYIFYVLVKELIIFLKSVKSRLLCKMLYNVFTISTYQN
ncbi:hypothetical protein W538_02037 [Staphylococcus aureus VET0261R]|nr:hypothetical protein [Staphylococcus aureus]KAC78480.1 hypothetical protein W538_02037 [Staphylococcus aureus VET0261R]